MYTGFVILHLLLMDDAYKLYTLLLLFFVVDCCCSATFVKYIPVYIILFTALHVVGMELNVNMQAEWGLENGDRATTLCSFSAYANNFKG